MRLQKRGSTVLAVSAGALVAAVTTGIAPAQAVPGRCEVSVPYTAGTEGYSAFRIPAIVETRSGDLLAFAEGRSDGLGDAGNIDTVVKRSTDGGCTWSPLRVVQDSGPNTSGNPAPVVTASGRVVLLTTYNAGSATETQILRGQVPASDGRRVFVQYSDDDGTTWSAPREITAAAKLPNWRWYATGPGHATRLTHGPHRGRLVVPANHSIAPPAGSSDLGSEAKYYGGHDLYSDDGGRTWHIGYVDDNPDGQVNVNETTATELPDGRVYFNTRDQNGTAPGNRADAYSLDGGRTLRQPFSPQLALAGPVVEGSVLQARGPKAPLLFSGPADPSKRAVMTLRTSRDGGVTWRSALTLSSLPASYSDLVQVDARTVGLLYETGTAGANETITFRRIDLRGLS
ncbi:sialidase family protein [Actinoallomurus rhizosphaericola]|uniref:sialidase family protein n=1 Tax=Actinoallomurus rhizosphaericola TaxID=2952536 RepID=UPI002093E45D|nr:sialidase family protein [Actinoallomurus rhizosphaericola]MCO5999022.1 glycoside hydrolase [Actinoallomurus rhizosphaericola]